MCEEPTDIITLDSLEKSGGDEATSLEVVRRCFVRIIKGEGEGRELKLGSETVIAGRSTSAGLFLGTSSASRKHFELVPERGGYVLRDLNSTNGTKVNRTRVAECRLSDGDIISVGKLEMVFLEKTRLEIGSGKNKP